MAYARIKPRRGTSEQWTTVNPILAEGEIAIECPNEGVGTGLVKVKIGDGVRTWNELPYAIDGSIDLDDFVAQTLDGAEIDKVPSVATVKNAIDGIGIYYNKENDGIYLIGKDGVPVLIRYGGLDKKYIYDNGFINTDFCGGIVNRGWSCYDNVNKVNTTNSLVFDDYSYTQSDTRYDTMPYGSLSATANMIDLTTYSKVVVKLSTTATNGYLSATTVKHHPWGNMPTYTNPMPTAYKHFNNSYGVVELDITNLTGEYYLSIAGMGAITVNEWWLEQEVFDEDIRKYKF